MLLWILQPLGLRSTFKTNGMMIKNCTVIRLNTHLFSLSCWQFEDNTAFTQQWSFLMCWRRTNTPTSERIKREKDVKKTKSVKERQGREQSRKEGSRVRRWSGAAGAERCSVAHEMELWAKEGGRLAGEKEERIMFSWAIYPICYLRVRQLHFLRLMHLETLHNAVFSSVFVLISVFCCVNYSNEDIFSAVEVRGRWIFGLRLNVGCVICCWSSCFGLAPTIVCCYRGR